VPIPAQDTKHVIGHAGLGNMLLKEMFSPLGGPQEMNQSIDWADDLKFHIDNTDHLLDKTIFPVLNKHKQHQGHPNVWKLYMVPVKQCLRDYCEKYDIEESNKKFTSDVLEAVARKIADEQEKHLKDGDYEKKKK